MIKLNVNSGGAGGEPPSRHAPPQGGGVTCDVGGVRCGLPPCKGRPPLSLVSTRHKPAQGGAPGLVPRTPSPPGGKRPLPHRWPISTSAPLSNRNIHGNQKQHHGVWRHRPRGEVQRPGGRARAGPGRGGAGSGLGVPEPAPALPALCRYQAGREPVAGTCRVGVSVLAVLRTFKSSARGRSPWGAVWQCSRPDGGLRPRSGPRAPDTSSQVWGGKGGLRIGGQDAVHCLEC